MTCTLEFNHNLYSHGYKVYYLNSNPQIQIQASPVIHTSDWEKENATAPNDLKWKHFVGNLQL